MTGKIEIKGLRDIERRLKGLGGPAAKRVVRNSINASGRFLSKKIKNAIPKRGGGRGFARGELRKAVSYRSLRFDTGVVRAKKPAGAHWHLWEFGTEKQAATLSGTRTLNANQNAALNVLKQKAEQTLDREYSKLGIK